MVPRSQGEYTGHLLSPMLGIGYDELQDERLILPNPASDGQEICESQIAVTLNGDSDNWITREVQRMAY